MAPPLALQGRRRSRRRRRIIVAGVVVACVGLVVGAVHKADVLLSHKDDLKPLQAQLQSMPCVTWAEGTSELLSVDVGVVASEEFGVSSHCSRGQIVAAYNVAAHYLDGDVQPGNGSIQISAREQAPPPPAHAASEIGTSSGARMLINPVFDGFPTGSKLVPFVRDWLSVRATIDPHAQLDGALGTDPYHSTPDERFTINTTTQALPSAAAALSPRLRAASWRVTLAPAGHAALTKENSAPAGALTIETNRGLPDALSVTVGRAVDGAWPSKKAGAHQYVSEYRNFQDETTPTVASEDLDSLSVEVFGVASSQSYSPPSGSESPYRGPATDTSLIPPDKTTAWPAITEAVDTLSTSGHPFGFGLELSSRSFTAGDDYALNDENTDFTSGLATLSSLGCVPVDPRGLSTDANVVEQSLYDYWLSRGRPGLMNLPGESCPV